MTIFGMREQILILIDIGELETTVRENLSKKNYY